jgi:hypothetical protein
VAHNFFNLHFMDLLLLSLHLMQVLLLLSSSNYLLKPVPQYCLFFSATRSCSRSGWLI